MNAQRHLQVGHFNAFRLGRHQILVNAALERQRLLTKQLGVQLRQLRQHRVQGACWLGGLGLGGLFTALAIATATATTVAARVATATAVAAPAVAEAAAPAVAKTPKPAMVEGTVTQVTAPLAGRVLPLAEVPDPVFAKGTVGLGVGIDPSGDTVYAPADGKIVVAQATGHAFGIALDSGIELLIHVGIDTVNLEGKGFDVKVAKGDRVTAGTPLVAFDRGIIEAAGYSLVTPVLVTNAKKFGSVDQIASGDVQVGDVIFSTSAKPAKA